MYYSFENNSHQVLFCTYYQCLWYCEFRKNKHTSYSIQDLIRKTKVTLFHKGNSYKITGKDYVFQKLSEQVHNDFYVLYKKQTYYICYQSLDNQIYYTSLNNNSVTKELISSDSSDFYKPMNLKLASLMDTNYLFSIQNSSKEQKSLIFLPLTKLDTPILLLDITTSCLNYELFTLEHTIYLVFPFLWENYVLNLYCFDQENNQWDFEQTLTFSAYCYDYFNVLQENNSLHMVYTINVFGVHLLYYKCILMYKKNALTGKNISHPNQSIEKSAELLYKSGSKITPSLLIKDNLLWINWLENNHTKSLCKPIVNFLS